MTHQFYDNKINMEGVRYLDELLVAYQAGKIDLPRLANRLDAARSGLLFADPEWIEDYTKLWGAIEECNALALDAGQSVVLNEHKLFLDDVVTKLRLFLSKTFLSRETDEF